MNSLTRYANLIRYIRNWPVYFADKFSPGQRTEYRYISRRCGHEMVVPAALRGIFKEIFMSDVYRMRALCAGLPEEPVVFDVGANIGLFSVAVQEYRPRVQVHAFEPLPSNVEYLNLNLAKAQGGNSTIAIHACAVVGTETSGETTLHFDSHRGYSPVASILDSFEKENTDSISVKTCTMEDIVSANGIERIDLLKLDCEGSEYEIVYTAGAKILNIIRQIVMETHDLDTNARCTDAMEAFLIEAGFKVDRCRASASTSTLWAVRDENPSS